MPAHSSPTVKRRRLAAELRSYRDRAGLTIDEVAQRLEWSTAKISRIENARVSVLPRDVKFLLGVYGVEENGEEWEALLALTRESRQKGWWHAYGDAIPDLRVGVRARSSADRRLRTRRHAGHDAHGQRRGDRKTRGGADGQAGTADRTRCT